MDDANEQRRIRDWVVLGHRLPARLPNPAATQPLRIRSHRTHPILGQKLPAR